MYTKKSTSIIIIHAYQQEIFVKNMHNFKVSPTNVSSPIQTIAALKEKLKTRALQKKILEREKTEFQDISTVGRRPGQKQKRGKVKRSSNRTRQSN